MKKKIVFFLFTIISLTIVSCNSQSPKQTTNDTVANDTVQASPDCGMSEDGDIISISDEDDLTQQIPQTQPEEKPKSTTQKAKTSAPSMGGKETLYISTYGANGKVWGHVTMNGKKGRGTIHDDDENSYSITVTRHGGELHGIDQNGREYVFRM